MTDEEMTARGWKWTKVYDAIYSWQRFGEEVFETDGGGSVCKAPGWYFRDEDANISGPFATLADAVRAAEGGET